VLTPQAVIAPARRLIDGGGKSWRSFALLASCDAVGGDSRLLAGWMPMAELLHVGAALLTGGGGGGRVISDCNFAVQLNHFIPDFLLYSVAVFLT
jgi:hypothetical protein